MVFLSVLMQECNLLCSLSWNTESLSTVEAGRSLGTAFETMPTLCDLRYVLTSQQVFCLYLFQLMAFVLVVIPARFFSMFGLVLAFSCLNVLEC